MPFFYLSYACEDRGFLGATVVSADNHIAAAQEARRLGISPGGQVVMFEVPPEIEERDDMVRLLNRLATKEEMIANGALSLGDIEGEERGK